MTQHAVFASSLCLFELQLYTEKLMQPRPLLKGYRGSFFLSSASGCARRSDVARLISWRKKGLFFVNFAGVSYWPRNWREFRCRSWYVLLLHKIFSTSVAGVNKNYSKKASTFKHGCMSQPHSPRPYGGPRHWFTYLWLEFDFFKFSLFFMIFLRTELQLLKMKGKYLSEAQNRQNKQRIIGNNVNLQNILNHFSFHYPVK